MIIIKPYGRLGNNIIQIINCIVENINLCHNKEINLTQLKNRNPTILHLFSFQTLILK